MKIHVLRLAHRMIRDARISTHVCLVARAFGAEKIYYTGQKDNATESSVARITEHWGGNFEAIHAEKWEKVVKEHKKEGYCVIHMTMYGMKAKETAEKAKGNDKILIIVGGEKVPTEVYHQADYNVSVGTQPHSEVAALAIMMHHITGGIEEEISFENAQLKIIPCPHGKQFEKK